jgi:DNA (cytosine-5)-methyltransferase 1
MKKMSNLSLSCLELFAGAGGLAKGLEMAKIKHKALIELDYNACLTLANNYNHQLIYNVDVRKFKFEEVGEVDIIAGGPPCQPFSLGGKHKGHMDQRDMFPYACKAISICKPKAFIFENVKGMLRPAFSNYFEHLILSLTYPEVSLKDLQFWEEHLIVLKTIDNSNNYPGVKYNVVFGLLNAANYGIPQRRERVFIVGIRQDLNINWSFPQPSHSYDSLLWSQFVSYDYWVDQRTKQKINQLIQKPTLFPPVLKPWKTIRDQIGELPQPDSQGSFDQEHILRQGARSYPGHNGSYIDMPSKTIKAGDHGVPGGENMIRYPDETVRYYTILEAKRIQTFPDNYRFIGCWTESMRQIGNAVPVELGYFLASSLSKALC